MRIAIIGGGPIGIEAAVEAEARGHEAVVYEAERVGEHLLRWSRVTMFTPWRMAVTERGASRIGFDPGDPEAFPTGGTLVERYLEPLARTLDVRCGQRVVAIGRGRMRKGQDIGSAVRTTDPFRIVVEGPDGEQVEQADVVLDCTGVFGDPAPVGAGGTSAPGERALRAAGIVRYGPVPVSDLAGSRVLLVGDGASAVTVLAELAELSPRAIVHWVTPSAEVPGFVSPDDDVLPARRALRDFARRAAADPQVAHHPGSQVDRLEQTASGVRVTLTDGVTLEVDAIVGCTGFRPDHGLSRELQLHLCYASEGPMKLAAALLSASGAGGDCLAQPTPAATVLQNPEPRFFVLGAKSYGRRSDFLLQIGHQQVRDALDLVG